MNKQPTNEQPAMNEQSVGWLSTHVLDTAQGCPAAGMKIALWRIDASDSSNRELLKQVTTNTDGRTDTPLLEKAAFQRGGYELLFFVGDYFQNAALALPDPPFLSQVPIQFWVADRASHYHVPLLVSPWSYSTYRGS